MAFGVGLALEEWPRVPSTANEPVGSAGEELAARVARLSQGQLDCLRLVNEHLSSKEIAAELDISPHTVDQRIRGALHLLRVERRSQAARIVAQYAGSYSGPYQRLIHQSPHIEGNGTTGHPEAA